MKCKCQPFFKNNQRPTKLCVKKSSLNSQLSASSVESWNYADISFCPIENPKLNLIGQRWIDNTHFSIPQNPPCIYLNILVCDKLHKKVCIEVKANSTRRQKDHCFNQWCASSIGLIPLPIIDGLNKWNLTISFPLIEHVFNCAPEDPQSIYPVRFNWAGCSKDERDLERLFIRFDSCPRSILGGTIRSLINQQILHFQKGVVE